VCTLADFGLQTIVFGVGAGNSSYTDTSKSPLHAYRHGSMLSSAALADTIIPNSSSKLWISHGWAHFDGVWAFFRWQGYTRQFALMTVIWVSATISRKISYPSFTIVDSVRRRPASWETISGGKLAVRSARHRRPHG
jgi:hypothetical protein